MSGLSKMAHFTVRAFKEFTLNEAPRIGSIDNNNAFYCTKNVISSR